MSVDNIICALNIVSGEVDAHHLVGVNSVVLQEYFFPVTFGGIVWCEGIGHEHEADAGQKVLLEL